MEVPRPPDCVEFNGLDEYALGMYQLDGTTRSGGLVRLDASTLSQKSLLLTDYGILDLRAVPGNRWLCACSDGTVKLIENEEVCSLKVSELTGATEQVIMGIDGSGESWASLSTGGELTWFSMNDGAARVTRSVQAHSRDFESWSVGVHAGVGLTVTGSDDCRMCLWSSKSGESVHVDRKEHSMGVTSFHFESENVLLSGSYDEKVRFWDLRNLSHPTRVVRVGGGVWRMRRLADQYLIAACYGGAEVWDADFNERLYHFDKHESMVYGISTDHVGSVISCSFYDKKVYKWTHDRIKYSC